MRSSTEDSPRKMDPSASTVLNSFSPVPPVRTFRPLIKADDGRELRADESLLDMQSALLIENISQTLTIHAEMFRRTLETTPSPSPLLAELLVDTGNRYLDFSKLVSALCTRSPMRKA
jgi:hypothetical protein